MKMCWPDCSPTESELPPGCDAQRMPAGGARGRRRRDDSAATGQAAKRVQVVAANTESQERGLLKHARIAQSVTAALHERGTDELAARLGAEMVLLAFSVAFERWMKASDDEPFSPFAETAFSDLQAAPPNSSFRPACQLDALRGAGEPSSGSYR